MRIHAVAPPARAGGGATCSGAPFQDATWNVRRAMRASVSVWVLAMGFAGVGGEGVCGEDRRLEAEAAGSQWVRTDTVAPEGRHFHAIAAAEHVASTVGSGLAARVRARPPRTKNPPSHMQGGWAQLRWRGAPQRLCSQSVHPSARCWRFEQLREPLPPYWGRKR